MSIPELRALIEPYLDSQGYIGDAKKSMRKNSKSYLNQLLEFMQGNNYEEISSQVIREYIKSFEGTSQLGARKKRCEEFAEYVKGERQLSMIDEKKLENENEVAADTDVDMAMKQESETPEPLENEPTNESVQSVSDVAGKNEPPVKEETPIESVQAESAPTEPQKAKDSPKKSKNENRTQISAFLSNEVYLSIKALAFSTQQPISDIVAQVLSAFCEDNAEVIQDSITAMQKLESVKSRIKYHR